MAKTIAKILGVVFVLVGLCGFVAPNLLGAHLTTMHNIVHLVSGAAALYFGFAAFLLGDGPDRMFNVAGLLHLGTMDHVIHILLGILFLIGGFLTKADVA